MEANKEMVGQIIDQLEDLLSDGEKVLFEGELYDKAATIIVDTLDKWNCSKSKEFKLRRNAQGTNWYPAKTTRRYFLWRNNTVSHVLLTE